MGFSSRTNPTDSGLDTDFYNSTGYLAQPKDKIIVSNATSGSYIYTRNFGTVSTSGLSVWSNTTKLYVNGDAVIQGTLAVEAVPMLIDILQAFLEKLAASPLAERFNLSPAPTQQLLEKAGAAVLAIVPKVLQRIASASGKLMQAFLAPVLAFYFLRDRELFCFQLSLLIPLQQRKKLLTALREMRREIAGYLRGQLLVSSAVGILTAIGLLIVGVPAWLLLGIVMGVCDLIPYVGPYLGGIPIVLFSLPQGLYTVLWAVVAVVAVQQAESMFLSPQLMSGVTGLHPAYVLLLLSAGGLLGGIAGMLLSLPLYVCARGAVRALQCAARENAP